MTLLQLGIGALNDVVDAPNDAGRKLAKPIPAGEVDVGQARTVVLGLFAAGVMLAVTVSAALGLLAAVVIGIGLAYDLRLKGTPWSWLPFAIGIPVLPVYGWVGATGTVPPEFAVLVPAAVAAGAALAISNSLVDVERDRDASRTSVAAELGALRAAAVASALYGGVGAAAVISAWLSGASGFAIAALLVAGGVALIASGASVARAPQDRERAWRAEAMGMAALAVLWVWVVLA